MNPLAEERRPREPVAASHSICAMHECKSEPLGPHSLASAALRIIQSGKAKKNEHQYVGMLVRTLSESMCGVRTLACGRENALNCIVSIVLHYPNPLAMLSKFTDSYNTLVRVEQMVRENRNHPVCVGMENEAKTFIAASRAFLSLNGLKEILRRVEACQSNGASTYPIEFISLEMLRRISGESKGESPWMKIPPDMP